MKTFKIIKDVKGDRYIMITKINKEIVAVNYHQGLDDLKGSESVQFEWLNVFNLEVTELYKTFKRIDKTLKPIQILNKITYGNLDN